MRFPWKQRAGLGSRPFLSPPHPPTPPRSGRRRLFPARRSRPGQDGDRRLRGRRRRGDPRRQAGRLAFPADAADSLSPLAAAPSSLPLQFLSFPRWGGPTMAPCCGLPARQGQPRCVCVCRGSGLGKAGWHSWHGTARCPSTHPVCGRGAPAGRACLSACGVGRSARSRRPSSVSHPGQKRRLVLLPSRPVCFPLGAGGVICLPLPFAKNVKIAPGAMPVVWDGAGSWAAEEPRRDDDVVVPSKRQDERSHPTASVEIGRCRATALK